MYSYLITKNGDKVYHRSVINNEIEESNFLQTVPAGHKIKIDKLSKDEISKLPFLKRLWYSVPSWVYWIIAAILFLATISKPLIELYRQIQHQ